MGALFFALSSEAKPWIDALGAKPDKEQGHFRFYSTDEHFLAVTGTGKIQMALAVAELAGKIPKEKRKGFRIWNLGIAGSALPSQKRGDFFWIHKIKDFSRGFEFFPERLETFSLSREAHLTTFDRPIASSRFSEIETPFLILKEEEIERLELIDMEGSGFFEAASIYFELEQIQLGKIVSDHLEGKFCRPEDVSELMKIHLDSLLADFLKTNILRKEDVLSSSEKEFWQKEGEKLNFTKSMLVDLEKSIRYYKLRFPEREIPKPPSSSKENPEKKDAKEMFGLWMSSLHV